MNIAIALIVCGGLLSLLVLLKVTVFPDHAPNTKLLIELLNRIGTAVSNPEPGNVRASREENLDGGTITSAGSVRSQQRPQPDGGGVSESSGC